MERNRVRDRDDDRGRSRDRDDDRGRDRGRDDDRGRGQDRDDDRGSRDRGGDDRGGRSMGSGRRSFTYERRDDNDAKRRAEGDDGKFDVYLNRKVTLYKVQDDNRIRVLPPTWEKPKHYGLDIWVHYGVGPDRQTYLCLNKMKGEPCPLCEERADAVRDGDEKYAKELEPRRRVLVYLLDREDRKNPGPYAWAMPQTLDRDIVKVSVDRDSGEVLPIDHHEEGFDVMFEKKGSKDRTEYLGVQLARRSSSVGDDAALDFIQDNPLPEMLVYYSYDHIAQAFGKTGGSSSSSDRGRDRDDDRGRDSGRGRDSDRGRDRGDDRGGRDRESDRGRSRDEPELTWASIHGMTGRELDDLIDDKKLNINPREAKDDEDLADWICDELKIEKAAARTRVTRDDDSGGGRERDKDDHESKLDQIRNRRRD